MLQIIEENKVTYELVRCIDILDYIWEMFLAYFVVDASIFKEVGPLRGDRIIG